MTVENTISNDQLILSIEELKAKGLTLYKINQLVDMGVLKKLNKKYYENTNFTGEESDYYYAYAYVPNGVVCLLSAAVYYNLTSYIPIISSNDVNGRVRYSDTKGIVIPTIESSLGLDFKAVVLAGLYPYNYVFPSENTSREVKTWSGIKNMNEAEQELVQSQMRSIYTACSRARDDSFRGAECRESGIEQDYGREACDAEDV